MAESVKIEVQSPEDPNLSQFDGNFSGKTYDGSGAKHIWGVDPNTGKETHLKNDDVLKAYGHDPQDSKDNLGLKNAPEQPIGNTEIDTLRGEMLEMIRQMEANNERRHQEMMALLQALVEQRQGVTAPNEDLPPGARVGEPEDEGMARMREHFSMLDGEESEKDDDKKEDEPPVEEEAPTAEQKLQAAEAALNAARDELVILTIRRRGRAGDGLTENRREDKENYDKAMAAYKEAIKGYLQALGEKLDVVDPNNPEAPKITEVEIQRELLKARYAEQGKFKEAEFNKNNELLDQEIEAGGLRKLKARILRKWANYSTKKKLLIGLGVGGAAALASGTLGAGLAVIAAGSAVKFSLGLLNRSASARNVSKKSYEHEVARLERNLDKSLLKFNRESVMASQANLTLGRESHIGDQTAGVEGELNRDVQVAQWRNRLGNTLMLLGAAGAVYGLTEVAGGLPHIGLWPFGPDHHYQPVTLKGIDPNTIHAQNPTQFQHGVLRLLNEQGVQAHDVTPDKIQHMNQWMASHPIASGMRAGNHGLEQNLTHFPTTGHEFANVHASADQGFRVGADGTGRHALDQWIREAEKSGIRFERTK